MQYFEVWYISCESNRRWFVAQCPADWSADDLQNHIRLGGCGDDIAEITEIVETCEPKDGIWTSYDDGDPY